ncbi:MAG: PilN domain-containing protein [Bacteroidetes bacterium]|nr:PilN domain-containing protein [Bacteroidota bacterium]
MKIQLELINFKDKCQHRTIITHKKIQSNKAIPKHPTIVLVSGKGVITKSYVQDKTIIQRVISNDNLYHSCNNENKEISFVRKEQVDCKIKQFSNILYIKICGKVDNLVIRDTISEFYKNKLTIKNLLKYKDDGKLISSYLIRKAEIPLMISVFIILLLNFFINAHISEMNNGLQMKLMQYKNNNIQMDSQLKDIKKIKMENIPNRSMSTSLMIDKLASQIPDSVTLNYLAVDPLKRKVEKKRSLITAKNTITIKGETYTANDITILTTNIKNLDFVKNIKIKQISKKKNNAMLEFEIEITY